ncbi:hypothetical protein Sjap_019046 [Stephania japonica]|uniref:Factor of DNA methylation 1-5/IDN2 domain-containing protein n=1 Tax=Stephania japonica TaxID=461633 RepID=A0AAP0F3I8_9MAGN
MPILSGKKKQDYVYKDLLQHATGVGKGSSNRSGRQKANHRALAKYLQEDLSCEPAFQEIVVKKASIPKPPQQDDLFVWPWTGIIINHCNESMDESTCLMQKDLSKYRLVETQSKWDEENHILYTVVNFCKDWTGFKDALAFEKTFEADHLAKKDWSERTEHSGPGSYGWFARADDYKSEGPIGDYLRNNKYLKTISEIVQETTQEAQNIVANLTNEIDVKNEDLSEWETKYNEQTISLHRKMEEKDFLQQAYNEAMRNLQRVARERTRKILNENDNLKRELDTQRREVEERSKKLDKCHPMNGLEEEKNDIKNVSLHLASMEQKKADENVLRLVAEQKREREDALKKIFELEKQLTVKQTLELEIEELKGRMRVMAHLGGADDTVVQQKMKEMEKELEEKVEEMNDMHSLNQTLLVKERESNDELQEARKVLMKMGELESKPFLNACMQKYPAEAVSKSVKLCSLWQEHIKNSKWYPFKVVSLKEGEHQRPTRNNNMNDESTSSSIALLKSNQADKTTTKIRNRHALPKISRVPDSQCLQKKTRRVPDSDVYTSAVTRHERKAGSNQEIHDKESLNIEFYA